MGVMEKGSSGRKDNRKVWFGCLAGVCAVTLLLAAILCFAGPLPGMGNGSRGPEAGMNGMGTRTDEMQGRENDTEGGGDGTDPVGYDIDGGGDGMEAGGYTGKDGVNSQEEWARKQLEAMSLEEKAAQLFIITPEQLTGCSQVTRTGEVTREALRKYPVGGLIYFSNHLEDADQLRTMTGDTQKMAMEEIGIPLFLSMDEEGGDIARIGNHGGFQVKQVPPMDVIGASGDSSQAYEAGSTIGAYLHEYGVNLDFAPDVDVLTNPDNTVVKRRSFGSDPQLVSEMSLAYLKGLWEHGVYGAPKHFPGHGATKGDSHEGFAYTDKTWEELEESELKPFYAMVGNQVPFIMAGHISLPEITGGDLPCSLSVQVIQEYLRDRMGYEGIIITDALNMGAIEDHYPSGQAAVMALKAGVDMLLMPADFPAAYEAVVEGAGNGEIPLERLDASVLRILTLKAEIRKIL
ncbi:hypothetical protein K250101E9_27390 [Enterocloster aldenensis]